MTLSFRRVICLFVAIVFCQLGVEASIIPVGGWRDLQPVFHQLKPQTLVVMDVDWTLIMHCDRILQPGIRPSVARMMEQAHQLTGVSWNPHIYSKMLLGRKARLLSPLIPSLLKEISDKESYAVALTALQTGTLGFIENLEEWRCRELSSLGIDLKALSPKQGRHTFDALARKGPPPVLRKGILFSASAGKGEVLAAFLKKVKEETGWSPSEVIFIDDHPPFLKSVQASMRAMRIKFRGFHISHPSRALTPLEKKVALSQMVHLLMREVWISDAEMRERLHRRAEEEGSLPSELFLDPAESVL